jgi:hypothetical protein
MQLRKIAAGISVAIMAGATMFAPVLAADLSSYPSPFVSDGSTNYLIVVGTGVDTKDVVGAINVGSRIAQEVKSSAATTGTVVLSTPSTAGADGASLKVEINDYPSNATEFLNTPTNIVLGSSGIAGVTQTATFLSKKTLTINSVDYDVKEKILVDSIATASDDSSRMKLRYNSSSYPNDIYFDLGQTRGNVKYMVSFNPEVYLDNLTSNSIYWLGKEYVVAKGSTVLSDGTVTKIKLTTATSQALKAEGESLVVEGVTVTLVKSVIPNSVTPYAIFKIEGGGQPTESLAVTEGADPVQDTGKRIEIYVDKAYDGYSKFYVAKSGTMQVLDSTKDTYNGMNWKVQFGKGQSSTQTYPQIGNITLQYWPDYNATSVRNLHNGDSISTPQDFFTVKYAGFTTEDATDMQFTSYNKTVLKVSTPGQTLLKVTGALYADTVYYDTQSKTWYYDITNVTTDGRKTIPSPVYIYYRADKPYQLAINGSNPVSLIGAQLINVTEPTTWSQATIGVWQIQYDNSTGTFGDAGQVAVTWTNNAGTIYNLFTNATSSTSVCGGAVCTNFMSAWGTKLKSATTSAVTLTLPKNQLYGQVIIGRASSSGKKTSGNLATGQTFEGVTIDSMSVSGDVVTPVETSVAKLATEITDSDKSASNMILIGGPCANGVVESILEAQWGVTDACAAWSTKVSADESLIKYVDDAFGTGKAALIVAGDKAQDTFYASEQMMKKSFWLQLNGTSELLNTVTGELTTTDV